ncbi:MAG: hypothetical protein WC919_00390 [Candidatus Paceibacterota bacterium]|jgi:hypothetical protein
MADQQCAHLAEFLKCEVDIIERHLARHKWYNKIPGEAEGIADFVKKYGWLMRELYCGYTCPDRSTCNLCVTVNLQHASSDIGIEATTE